jgi:hypothetical protein
MQIKKLINVLLIGNSYIIRNELGKIINSYDPQYLNVKICAGGSATWRSHLQSASNCIPRMKWDVVVLQEQSRLMLHNMYDDNDGVELVNAINDIQGHNNTKILLMETWAYERGWSWYTRDQMQDILREGYIRVAKKIGPQAEPLLVGDTIIHAADSTNLSELWDWDERHPGIDTTLITACMIFGAIMNESCPEGGIYEKLSYNITI